MLQGCQLTVQQLPCSRLQLITICSTLKCLIYILHALIRVAKIKNRDRRVCSHVPGKIYSRRPISQQLWATDRLLETQQSSTLCHFHTCYSTKHPADVPVIQMQVTELSPAVIFTISGWEPQPRLQGAPASNSKLTSMQIYSILFPEHTTTASGCFPSQVPAHILIFQHVFSTWSSPRVQAQTPSPKHLCIKFQAYEHEIPVQSFPPGKWQLHQHASNHMSLHASSCHKPSAHDLLHNCWHEHRLLAHEDQGGPFLHRIPSSRACDTSPILFARHMRTALGCFQSPGLGAHLRTARGLSTWSSLPLQAQRPAPYAWRPRNTEQTEHHHSQSQTRSPCPILPPSQTHNVHISTRKSNTRPGREEQVHLSLHSTSGCSHHSSSRPTSPTRLSHSHPLPSSHRPQTRSHHHSSLHRLLPRRSSPQSPSSSLS